ncbi:MAG: hypothetical protein GXY77_09420 [Fibrobacter sp.]|nr:hypothetical protein [Fibrobacter sp.]
MKNKIQILLLIFVISSGAVASLDVNGSIRIAQQSGVGTRAAAMANNYVALSNDLSGLFWNPAGIAFSPVREFQTSLEGTRLNSESKYFGTGQFDDMQRMKISGAGLMIAIPATQGGLTVAGAFQNPIIFDEISSYKGRYLDIDNRIIEVEHQLKNSGGLRLWSAGVGLQIAPSLAAGLALSLISGKDDAVDNYMDIIDNDLYSENNKIEGKYFGYDLRLGMMYRTDLFGAGIRFCIPQIIKLREWNNGDRMGEALMYSSYSGAGGFSFSLPFVTVSVEGRATLPLDYLFPSEPIPSNSQASRFKKGGGIGLEFPMIVVPVLLRLGYSYDDLDLYQYVIRYEDENGSRFFDWHDNYGYVDQGIEVDKNRQQLTAGLGFFNSSASFDISYGYQFWSIITRKNLKQDYNTHRVSTSLAIRF